MTQSDVVRGTRMASNETATAQGGLRPARRTIVKGAAWAVPVVTVASAAPASAHSHEGPPPSCLELGVTADSCRVSNTDAYFLGFCITNRCAEGTQLPPTFTFEIENNSNKPFVYYGTDDPFVVTIPVPPAQGQSCTAGVWLSAGSNANGVKFYYNGVLIAEIDSPQKTDWCADHVPNALRTVGDATEVEKSDSPAVDKPTSHEEPAARVEEPVVETPSEQPDPAPAPGADTESSTASPKG
ncbi:hypothetical protein [Ornithinimicrobium cryptoxanthini]|uniref:hypothetical protein n=1 Tax=Ornithinimicrobium cryptoxanthini TaxID=2934161 RepID=UPI0021175DAE|nr:hypothetical protein [Ornithinimicrobium cryptoxanthini]